MANIFVFQTLKDSKTNTLLLYARIDRCSGDPALELDVC